MLSSSCPDDLRKKRRHRDIAGNASWVCRLAHSYRDVPELIETNAPFLKQITRTIRLPGRRVFAEKK
jgi:hypothetical protein